MSSNRKPPAQKLREISEALWNAIIAKDYDGMREQARRIDYLAVGLECEHEKGAKFRADILPGVKIIGADPDSPDNIVLSVEPGAHVELDYYFDPGSGGRRVYRKCDLTPNQAFTFKLGYAGGK